MFIIKITTGNKNHESLKTFLIIIYIKSAININII